MSCQIARTDLGVVPIGPYTFGEDAAFYQKLAKFGMQNWSRAVDIQFPKDIVFINRTLSGHFGNLSRLGARGPWREQVRSYAEAAIGRSSTGA